MALDLRPDGLLRGRGGEAADLHVIDRHLPALEALLMESVFGEPADRLLALADEQALAAWATATDSGAARVVGTVVELCGGRIAEQVLAPTEWNFHPQGALVRGLAGLEGRDRDELALQAELLVQAMGPCVAHRIRVH